MKLVETLLTSPVLTDVFSRALFPSEEKMPLCLLAVDEPDRVIDAHRCAIASGVQVILTNTTDSDAWTLQALGLGSRLNEINWSAAQVARQAAKESGALVAGRVCLPSERLDLSILEPLLKEQIGALLDGGAQAICFQGFPGVEELALGLYLKNSLHHCPAICTLQASAGAEIQPDAFRELVAEEAEVIGLTGPMAECLTGLKSLAAAYPVTPLGVFADHHPAWIAEMEQLTTHGPVLIGGGQGVGLELVQALTNKLRPPSA